MNQQIKYYLKRIILFILKWKFTITPWKAFIRCLSAIVTINVGLGFYIFKEDNRISWGLSYGEIGWIHLGITIAIVFLYIAYLIYCDRESIRNFKLDELPRLTKEQTNALKLIHDHLIQELTIIDESTLNIVSRGGLGWYSYKNNYLLIPNSIIELESSVLDQRAFIDDDLFVSLRNHISNAKELSSTFQSLVMALSTADDQDAMTSVYDITYEQEIQVSVRFVKMMMKEFHKVDKHPVYDEYAERYKKVNTTGMKLIKTIKSKMGNK